jgi:hypothetical protein
MQYLVNVIDSRSNSGTAEEGVAIDEFNDKLRAGGHWVFAAGLADPTVSTVIDEDAVTAIERLKRTTDVPMRSHGSISLNRALLAAGLVDRLEVMVFPAITGRAGYASLLQDGAEFDLDLIESTVLDGRTVKLVYAPHLHTAVPEGVGPKPRAA